MFSSKEIKDWLTNETSPIFVPIHKKAQKTTDEMKKTLDALAETSKMLLDSSGKEIEKRSLKTYKRARALNKLARLFLERIRKIKIPEKVTYDELQTFAQESQKAFTVTDIDIRKWFPRISPFFILDRRKFQLIFEKSKETLTATQDFLTQEYVQTKTIEETFELIQKLQEDERELTNLEARKERIQIEKTRIQEEISERKQKLADLRNEESMSQLSQAKTEIDALEVEVKYKMRHFEKPFVKLQSLASRDGGTGLTPEELDKLGEYVQSPFNALSSEEIGYPLLGLILRKMNRLISERRLKLKLDKARKAQQDIDEMVNRNSLMTLHQKCRNIMSLRNQLSKSEKIVEIRIDLSDLQTEIDELMRKEKAIETKEESLQTVYDEALAKISNHKSDIENNIMKSVNRKVHIT